MYSRDRGFFGLRFPHFRRTECEAANLIDQKLARSAELRVNTMVRIPRFRQSPNCKLQKLHWSSFARLWCSVRKWIFGSTWCDSQAAVQDHKCNDSERVSDNGVESSSSDSKKESTSSEMEVVQRKDDPMIQRPSMAHKSQALGPNWHVNRRATTSMTPKYEQTESNNIGKHGTTSLAHPSCIFLVSTFPCVYWEL